MDLHQLCHRRNRTDRRQQNVLRESLIRWETKTEFPRREVSSLVKIQRVIQFNWRSAETGRWTNNPSGKIKTVASIAKIFLIPTGQSIRTEQILKAIRCSRLSNLRLVDLSRLLPNPLTRSESDVIFPAMGKLHPDHLPQTISKRTLVIVLRSKTFFSNGEKLHEETY